MRQDGTRVKNLTPIMQALPYILPRRFDAQNWASDYVDEEIMKQYIRQKRREGHSVTHMSVLAAAYYKAALEHPKVNYFVMNRKIYKRNHFCFSFVILKTRADGTPDEITPELMRVAQHAAGEAYGLISLVVSFAMEVLESLEQRTVHTSGIAHLLELPEYRSLERAQPLLSYLSEDADPARFPVPKDAAMKILIGPENVADALKDTSVVVASYDIGDGMRGVIGVVGPTRMDYAKITARLSYLAEGLTRLFGQGELPGGSDDHK